MIAPLRTVRPADLAHVWINPRAGLRDLWARADQGELEDLAGRTRGVATLARLRRAVG